MAEHTSEADGLTVEALAAEKRLPPALLRSLGITTMRRDGRNAVRIPYPDPDGSDRVRYRISLDGDRFRWRSGDKALLYGLQRLPEVRAAGWVVLYEGESDCWTAYHYGLPALGVPGKSIWRPSWAKYFDGLTTFIWQEPGASDFPERIGAELPAARVIVAPDGIKDLSAAHLQGEDVPALLERLKTSARTIAAIRAERDQAELPALQSAAIEILNAPDPVERIENAIRALGYGGDLRPALLTYLAITSRLLAMRPGAMPVHLLLLGPPSAGKSYTLGTVVRLMPSEAYHTIDAGSPRVLIYDTAELRHRAVIFGEADSLPAGEDNPAASAIRNLLQDHHLHYKVTIRDPETGDFAVADVNKEGPSVLLTTATRRLGAQLDSRLFSLEVPDDQGQIRASLAAQATIELHGGSEPSTALIAYQTYLQALAPWDVVVPFADQLAAEIGRMPAAPRIARDYARLISLVKAVAVLRHPQRTRDSRGRLVATVADYMTVHEAVAEVYQATVSGASANVRAAIMAVTALGGRSGGTASAPVSVTAVATHLGINKMAASRRLRAAAAGGYLVNAESRKGYPAAYILGDPLPDDDGLPHPDRLGCNTVTPLTAGDSGEEYTVAADTAAATGDKQETSSRISVGEDCYGVTPVAEVLTLAEQLRFMEVGIGRETVGPGADRWRAWLANARNGQVERALDVLTTIADAIGGMP